MSDEVARYYDRNTRRFLWMGSGGGVYALHRELWGPGVRSSREAAGYINRVLADRIASLPIDGAPTIIDFGCGVGGTLFHLAERFPHARLRGITLSGRQVEIADRIAADRGYGERYTFTTGDFQTVDLGVCADAIVAVESFVHSADADAFFANAARHLRDGGRLFVADDFLASEESDLDARRREVVGRFRAGWRVPSLRSAERLVAGAEKHGFREDETVDLTSFVRPGSRLRDHLTAAVSPLLSGLHLERYPFCGNLIGGHALQVGTREGFLRYKLLVLRKGADSIAEPR